MWVSVSGNRKPNSSLEPTFVPVLALIWINLVCDEHYWFQWTGIWKTFNQDVTKQVVITV